MPLSQSSQRSNYKLKINYVGDETLDDYVPSRFFLLEDISSFSRAIMVRIVTIDAKYNFVWYTTHTATLNELQFVCVILKGYAVRNRYYPFQSKSSLEDCCVFEARC